MSKYEKIHLAGDYLHAINKKWFKLPINTVWVPYEEKEQFKKQNGNIILAHYTPKNNHGLGKITFNVESMLKMTLQQVYELVRHEYAHAVVDFKYNQHADGDHGPTWIRIAKLMRVDTKRYEYELEDEKLIERMTLDGQIKYLQNKMDFLKQEQEKYNFLYQ